MAERSLPTSRAVLEVMFKHCSEVLDEISRLQQRDQERLHQVRALLKSGDEETRAFARNVTSALKDAIARSFARELPDVDVLREYIDQDAIADAVAKSDRGIALLQSVVADADQLDADVTPLVSGFETLIAGHEVHLTALRSLQRNLHDALESTANPDDSTTPPRIEWCDAKGELLLSGKRVASFAGQATRMRAVLGLFQEADWPPAIEIPQKFHSHNWDDQYVRDTVASLNDKCKEQGICFYSANAPKLHLWRVIYEI